MQSFRPFVQPFLARALWPVVVSGLALSLVGCDRAADNATASNAPAATTAASNSSSASQPSPAPKGAGAGITLKGEGVAIDATAAPALLGGYSSEPLSFRIMAGWVNQEKIQLANQEADAAEKRKKAMGTFGTITLEVAASEATPGTYQLAAEGGKPQTGTVGIQKAASAGIASAYTSQSGTLTVQSVTMDATGKVAAIEGAFDGQFSSDAGDSRAFSGSFRFLAKN